MQVDKEIKVGDLVKYSYDPASHMVYLVGAIKEADAYISKGCPTGRQRFAALVGWDRDWVGFGIARATDGNQWFEVQWLELVKSASR